MDTPASIATTIKAAFAPNVQHFIHDLDVPEMSAARASLEDKGFCSDELIGSAIEGFTEQVSAELRRLDLFLAACNEHEDKWGPDGMYVEFGGPYRGRDGALKISWVSECVVFDNESAFFHFLKCKVD